jgi:translation initiation factor IF-2
MAKYDPDEFFSAERQLTKKLTKEKRQLTNADMIRQMSDAELAVFMTAVTQKSAEKLCENLKTVDVDLSNCDFGKVTKVYLDWLQQEVEHGESN